MKHLLGVTRELPARADCDEKQRGGGDGKFPLCCSFLEFPTVVKFLTTVSGEECRCG